MPFFFRFDPETKLEIMKHSKLVHFRRGEYVFHQGDKGDSMYIIIAGSCDIMVKQPHPKTKEMVYQVVANVADGNSFGDFALLSDIETICQEEEYDE